MESNSEKQTALITGASRGIGRACAQRLAQDGFFVAGTATSQQGADDIAAALGQNGAGFVFDGAQQGAADKLFADIAAAQLPPPAVLVNNAGATADGLLLRMKDEQWARVLQVNLTAAFALCRAAAKHMFKERRGRIINISSVVAARGNAGQANYVAAKAGLEGMTRALARELGGRGITANAVAPGFIDTDMTRALPDNIREELQKHIPLQRLGAPSDVAAAVAFLASPAAGYITGHTLAVNGGMEM